MPFKHWLKENAANCIALLIPRHISKKAAAARKLGYSKGKADGLEAGYTQGYQAGQQEGDEAGYVRGLADGERLWRIVDERTPVALQPLDTSVYGPRNFTITNEIRTGMMAAVRTFADQKKLAWPNDQQWEMIFSDHPATVVAAGAGSGKSTTLVLRVVLMVVYLGIDLNSITIVSFTNAAVRELRRKLVDVLKLWDFELDDDMAVSLVKTFHSVLYRMSKRAFRGHSFFENDKDEKEPENQFSVAKLSSIQLGHLNAAYSQLYNADDEFRASVLKIMEIESLKGSQLGGGKEPDDWRRKMASERDLDLAETLNDRWRSRGLWPIDGVEEGPFPAFSAGGFQFYANGRIGASGRLVFLSDLPGFAPLFGNAEMFHGIAIGQAIGVKRNIIAHDFAGLYFYVGNRPAIDALKLRVRFDIDPVPPAAPTFDVRLDGELVPSTLIEALWSQGSFIESLDWEVPVLLREMAFKSKGLEYHFCAALGNFWPAFEAYLDQRKIMTYNRAFMLLSKSDELERVAFNVVQSLQHVLVDEFQDISPQIVAWLVACQRKVAAAQSWASIMAIGDDWQSIYGWRGSAPDFFIDFHKRFPIHPSVQPGKVCLLEENHRSVMPIVADAGRMIHMVKRKYPKQVNSNRAPASEVERIHLHEGDIEENFEKICDRVYQLMKQGFSSKTKEKNKVILLCRTNEHLNLFEEKLFNLKRDGLAIYTFHGAKGLQGEAAVVVGDPSYDLTHEFRNRAYEISGHFKQTYDEAMQDEAYRVAYVALTRGIRQVHWYVSEAKYAAKVLKGEGVGTRGGVARLA